MREAVGGALLFNLIIPIIMLFIIFIAFIMNYAAAYRAANYFVTQLETCQGGMDQCDHTSIDMVKAEIREKYYYNTNNIIGPTCSCNARGAVCRVELPVTMELPLLGEIGMFNVKAETKTLYGSSMCG